MKDLALPLTAEEIAAARRRIEGAALRTPLVPARDGRTWLKLECLQRVGSYKIRGATNALKARLESGERIDAIVTASAGNFGQAIVAAASALGLRAIVHVPDHAARVKIDNLKAMGAQVREHDFADWWRIMESRETGDAGAFFHPVCEREVIAGTATIGAELVEDLPDVEAVLVPIGGGGLACGIAQAVRAHRPGCRILAVETDTALPLKAALEAGAPVTVERIPSFVDGMGSTRVLDAMWPLLERLVDEVVVVSLAEVEAAIRALVADHHVIAEGAGAAAFAAAARTGIARQAAIVSGGNLDRAELLRILGAG
ncbi:MAG TPA: pyridoxal-phosphate dependent enzyme [Allosphingosinicella sp.]